MVSRGRSGIGCRIYQSADPPKAVTRLPHARPEDIELEFGDILQSGW